MISQNPGKQNPGDPKFDSWWRDFFIKMEKHKTKFKFTRKIGIIIMLIGIAFQFLNILTYGQWGIDIDIIGALIFIAGLVIMIVKWKK